MNAFELMKFTGAWETHMVTYNLNGGTRTGGGALIQEVANGDLPVVPIFSKTNYTFRKWDSVQSGNNLSYTARYYQVINDFIWDADTGYLGTYQGSSASVSFASPVSGVAVSSMAPFLFYNKTNITSINMSFPSTLQLERSICQDLTSLQTASLSAGSTGPYAFYGCTALTSVTLTNITTLSSFSFANCNSLESLTMPATLTTMGGNCIVNCSNFKHLHFDGNAPPGFATSGLHASFAITYHTGANGFTTPTMQGYPCTPV